MKKIYVALLFVFVGGVLRAQSPGGVGTGLSLWLKPDGLSAGTLNTWNYSNNSNSFAAGPTAPTVVTNAFNFLPAVNFTGTQYMSGPSGANAPLLAFPAVGSQAYAIFAVWSSSVAVGGGNQRVWAQRQANGTATDVSFDGASLFIYPNAASVGSPYGSSAPTYGDQPEEYPYVTGVNTAASGYATAILTYSPNTPYISSMNLLDADVNDLQLMDQTNYATGPGVTSTDPGNSATTNRQLSNQANLLGVRSTAGDEAFVGNLAELVVYQGSVTPAQRQQIFSYLSIKYGIPLGGSYFSSAGTTIWDATANGAYGFNSYNYNNFVFGLGKDVASGLNTTQSNSTATGSGSGAGQSAQGNITLANPSALSDQGFTLIGSNNTGFAETTSNLPTLAAAGSKRLATQWLVQNSGTVGYVDVNFDFTGITTTGVVGTSSDFRLVTDNDGDGNFTTGTQTFYGPSSWNGNVATFSQIPLTGATKAVFAILSSAASGTPLPVNWLSFTAVPNGADVDLNWTVSANQDAKSFEVQRSVDGTNFSNIGEVANDVDIAAYSYVDAGVGAGAHYYRIQEVDQDGKSIYSKIVAVNGSGSDFTFRLLNNPVSAASTDAELQVTTGTGGNVLMEIWTLSGSRVGSFQQAIANGTTTIRVPLTGVAAGTYAVKIQVGGVTHVAQIVKLQ